jgi:putative oxygen-independent coproporphyrinogen III oxidase
LLRQLAVREPLSIYLHWPFCGSKCPYCDFNSHVRPAVDERRWVNATITALDYWHERYPNRQIQTIFCGGGTPSLISPGSIEGLISHIAGRWQLADDCEITLEANPTTHEAERFRGFRSAGVNRLSLGVQSFEQTALDFLGRTYTVAEAERAIASIAETFPRYSFDLIYALPDQSPERWRKQLAQALSFGSKHLSLYQLTFEPGTRFYQAMRMGRIIPLDDDAAADLYGYTVETLAGGGLEIYEISNFAVPDQECRHNLVYWTGGDWIGVGPGAHGRIGKAPQRIATTEWRSPEKWLQSVEATGVGCEDESALAEEEIAEELVLTGLRLSQGINREQFLAVSDRELSSVVASDKLAQLTSSGLAISDNDGLRLTAAGRQVLDAVVHYTLAR